MKKPKIVKPFFFKDMDHEQLAETLNNEYPINLKHNSDLIDRIYLRYPLISKPEIAIIVTAVFKSFRELLVLGNILNFNNLFFDTKLFFFDYKRDGHILPSLKVKITTPPPIRKNND